jgi:RNA polymerase sigma factor (sigma-70 family)
MPESPLDADFVERLNRSTDSAAAELDLRYRQRLRSLVERELNHSLRSREDPEDVVQTVFRTYFRRAAQGEFCIASGADLWALLARITRRKILKRAEYHQAGKRSRRAEVALPANLEGSRDPGPVDATIVAELVERTLHGLDPRAAGVFRSRLAGCTEKEIAAQLSCTRAEVRMHLKRIRDRLAALEKHP